MTKIEYKNNYAIFLDCDGVLNSDKTVARTPNRYIGISSDKVKLLREIVKVTGANIILSSSWRTMDSTDPDYKYLVKCLGYKGLFIKDKTSKNFGHHRGKQIREYLNEHPEITNYLIIDDEFVQEFEECGLSEHFLHTDYTTGLTKKDVVKAIEILNNQFNYKDCRFSEEELRLLQGALFLCEEKQLYNQEQTYLKSMDLRNKIKILLKEKDSTDDYNHFGRVL